MHEMLSRFFKNDPNAQVVILKRGLFDKIKWILGFLLVLFIVIATFSGEAIDSLYADILYFDEDLLEIDASAAEGDAIKLGYMDLRGLILSDSVGNIDTFTGEPVITPEDVAWQISYMTDGVDDIQGVVIRMATPGGMVSASDEIARMVRRLSEQMPVYVYSNDILASGGYYIAVNADKIFAHKEAEIGSIGVIYELPNIQNLAEEKLGIDMEVYKAGQYKDMNSPFRGRTEEEKQLIQSLVNDSYEAFIATIVKARNVQDSFVRPLATGQVWRGEQARTLQLVDDTLYRDELIARIKKEMDIVSDVVLVQYQQPPSSLFDEIGLSVAQYLSPRSAVDALGQKLTSTPAGLYYRYYR